MIKKESNVLYLLTIFLSLMVNQTTFAKQDKRILVVGDSLQKVTRLPNRNLALACSGKDEGKSKFQ